MKSKILYVLAFAGFIGMVHANEPRQPEPLPVIAKCMKFHQYTSIAQFSNTESNVNAAKDYFYASFTPSQITSYYKLIDRWNSDVDIYKTYKSLLGPDIHGKSLTPAVLLAACVKAM